MIRWREMLMDYGQMYGEDNKGGAYGGALGGAAGGAGGSLSASSFFTVDGDLMAKRDADLELRRVLEVHFRPLFQRFVYGGEKIACHDLKRVLQDPQYRDKLPQDKVHELIDVADFNSGRSIKYDEFIRIVMGRPMGDAMSEFGSIDGELQTSEQMRPLTKAVRFTCRNATYQDAVIVKAATYKCIPPPFFMILVTLAQVVTFIVYAVDDDVTTTPLEGVPQNNSLMYMPTRRREAWRFVSYSLVHQGFIDLFCNVLIQIVVGVPVEIMFGWWRMAIVYMSGVIVGSCTHSILEMSAGLVGGAGGAYALLGAHIISLIKNRNRLNLNSAESRVKHFLCSVYFRLALMLVLIVLQVGLAIYRRWFISDITWEIGIAAHITGLIMGLSMGGGFLTEPKFNPFKDGPGIMHMFLLLAIVGGTVVFNIVFSEFPDEDSSSLSDFLDGRS